MEIQIIVPWGSDGNLGAAYNRLMKSVDDWVCFLDHDILNLNPQWYHMCLNAVKSVGHRAGWITGTCNAIACPAQLCQDAPKNVNLASHMQYAKKSFNKYGNKLYLIEHEKLPLPFSGFMILTHKEAWEKVGGFDNGFLGVDNYYYNKITKAGYQTYVMPGLYMFHTYGYKSQWNTI